MPDILGRSHSYRNRAYNYLNPNHVTVSMGGSEGITCWIAETSVPYALLPQVPRNAHLLF